MKKIVLDENGNVVDELEVKNNEIKAKLEVVLREFLDERDEMKALKKATKLGYRFTKQLYYEFAKYPPMNIDDFTSLDYDILNDLWLHYLDLTAYYNRYFEIVDNKQLWCAYSGLNSRQYSQLEKSDDEDIRNLMNSINSAFIGLGFIAAESGNADVKGVNQRLRSSGEAGHSVVTAAEEKVIEQGMGMTKDELSKKLLQRGIVIIDEPKRLK